MALDALAPTTVWSVILFFMDYPREDWIGVIVVGYVSFWIVRGIVSYPLRSISEHLLHRIKMLAMRPSYLNLPRP